MVSSRKVFILFSEIGSGLNFSTTVRVIIDRMLNSDGYFGGSGDSSIVCHQTVK